MKPTTLSGILLGLIAGPAAVMAAPITAVEIHNGDKAGKKWENGNPKNNDQRGAGIEHSKIAFLPKVNRFLVLGTASYTDIVNAEQVDIANTRLQVLCAAYELDPKVGLKQVAMKYVTNNDSPDYQNGHKLASSTIDGRAAAIFYGYDKNGVNTATYAQVLDGNCNNMSGTEFAQTLIIAKNNDDVGGNKWLEKAVPVAGSTTVFRAFGTQIGNGNGQDDGWLTGVKVTLEGDKATIAKTFDHSIVTNEERSRSVPALTSNPSQVLVAWAEGNNQPCNRGVRVGLINVDDNAPANGRTLFKQYIKERQENVYYCTPDLVNVPKADGTPSDKFVLQYVKVDRNGINGRNKGKTTSYQVLLTLTNTGVTLGDTVEMSGIGDAAHPGLLAGVYGPDKRFVSMIMNSTITDGGTGTAALVGINAAGKLERLSTVDMGMSVAGGWISQYYGNNPNTPQGRNYAPEGVMVDNPGYGLVDGYQPLVEKFMAMSISGTKKRGAGNGGGGGTGDTLQDKLAWDLVLMPMVEGNVVDPLDPDAPPPAPGTDPTAPPAPTPTTPDTDNNGSGIGGCSTGNGSTAGFGLLVLGLALARRRRS